MATYTKGGSTDTWTFAGNVAVGGNLEVTGTEVISGDTTYGNAVTDSLILMGRLVTGAVAGSALSLGATYLYNEHIEIRANVTDWATKAANFTGAYLRYGNTVKTTSYNLTGMELNVSSDAAVVNLSGLYSETQCKALAAGSTWTKVKGIEANLSLYDQTQTVAVTEGMCFYGTIGLGSGYTAYTGLHGLVIETRDGSVGTRTLGSGIILRNISPAEGTQTFTKGIQVAMAAVTGISLEGAMTDGILISGAATDGIHVSGATTNGINLAGTSSAAGIVVAGVCADGILVSSANADGIHISGANTVNAIHISGDQAVAVLVDVDESLATGVSFSVDTGKTVTTGISMTGAGAVTTGINFAPEVGTYGISIGLAGKTYTGGILLGTGGGTITTGMSFLGAMTAGINFGSASAIGTLINATGACAHLATRGVFIGEDSNSEGSGIALNGASWATSQGNAFYSDDGGVAATGYTETMTVRHLSTATVASGDVSFTPLHTDLYLNANYAGIGGLSSIWGNTTIATGKTIDTSGGLGDVGGATFGIDIVGVLAANSHACGVSVGVGGSGTKTGILSGYRIRAATGTVDWDAVLSIEDGDGSWTSMTTSGSNTATMTNSPKTGNPAYWLNVYIGETKYYFPVWTA